MPRARSAQHQPPEWGRRRSRRMQSIPRDTDLTESASLMLEYICDFEHRNSSSRRRHFPRTARTPSTYSSVDRGLVDERSVTTTSRLFNASMALVHRGNRIQNDERPPERRSPIDGRGRCRPACPVVDHTVQIDGPVMVSRSRFSLEHHHALLHSWETGSTPALDRPGQRSHSPSSEGTANRDKSPDSGVRYCLPWEGDWWHQW